MMLNIEAKCDTKCTAGVLGLCLSCRAGRAGRKEGAWSGRDAVVQ